ncbi:MAG TPA: HAD family hydrolase [Gemmataceae bacterium]|jgi:HAD superfamily hydrolase (TIGR01509 family)|nr:HAD family hydrolase [Gemmataceae bacterium]
MKAVRGVILDVDGTLVDSNDAHSHAWVVALAENGVHVPLEKGRRLIGMGGDKLLPLVSGLKEDCPQGEQISKRRGDIFKEKYLASLRAFPGTKDLRLLMRAKGLRLVVASSAKSDELKPLLEVCGADEVIEDKTSSDDADRSKPDPDIVHAALKKIGLPPAEVVMMGDTPYDIEAATRAGVAVIALRSGGWNDGELAGALAVYQDPADFLARYDTSALAR